MTDRTREMGATLRMLRVSRDHAVDQEAREWFRRRIAELETERLETGTGQLREAGAEAERAD